MTFRGTITAVSADNLAAWSIGGYKALGSAFRKCQYCMADNEEMQTKVLNTISTSTSNYSFQNEVEIQAKNGASSYEGETAPILFSRLECF